MPFIVHKGELPISDLARKNRDLIFLMFPNKRARTLRTIDRISLLRYHFPKIIPSKNNPLDVILIDFNANIFHLYTAGANINSGVPYQAFMLIRTVLETIVKDMRLLSMFENDEEDYENMYKWIIEKDKPGYDPELRTWGFAVNRDYLFEGKIRENVRDLYSNLSKLVHGSSRLATSNVKLSKEIVESGWDHLFWIAFNSLLLVMYSFRNYLPFDKLYQGYILEIINDFNLPSDFLITEKLPNLKFNWLQSHLKV